MDRELRLEALEILEEDEAAEACDGVEEPVDEGEELGGFRRLNGESDEGALCAGSGMSSSSSSSAAPPSGSICGPAAACPSDLLCASSWSRYARYCW